MTRTPASGSATTAQPPLADTPPLTPTSGPTTPAPARIQPAIRPEPEIPQRGNGQFTIAPSPPDDVATSAGIRYTVEVEDDVPYNAAEVAATVDNTIQDSRGWGKEGATFTRVSTGANTRIVLATPDTVDRLCSPLQTNGKVSCRNGDMVVLNAARWAEGAMTYGDDLRNYRRYLINHEVGHRLGRSHQTCPTPGAPAPVMVQQTKALQGCEKNPWP